MLTFKTPPSFSFDTSNTLWTRDSLKEQVRGTLQALLLENRQEKRQAHAYQSMLNIESAMAMIQLAAEMFHLSSHVRYIAIDLFQRFMLGHIDSLLAHVMSTTTEGRQRSRLLKLLEKRVTEQAALRTITCVMIASKLVTHKQGLTVRSAQKFLKCMEINFHSASIVRSERRILEQLDSRCYQNSSMLAFIGVVISVVGLWEGDGTNFTDNIKRSTIKPVLAEPLFEMSLNLLDMVYLNREKVYQDLYTSLTGLPAIPDKHRAAFSHVMADRILLAASVVASAAFILGGQEICAAVIASITTNIHTPCKDIITMATCILNCAGLPCNIKSLLA